MMLRRAAGMIVMMWLGACAVAWAQSTTAPDAARLAGQIAPFLNNQTAVLVHVNLDLVDTDAIAAFVTDAMAKTAFPPEDIRALADNLRGTKAKLKELTVPGIHELYAVVGFEIPTVGPPPVALIVPLTVNSDEPGMRQAMLELLTIPELVGRAPEVTKLNGALVMGSAQTLGDAQAVAGRGEAKVADATALLQAMDSVGHHAVDLVVAPTPDMRRVVAELMPKLPQEVGGGGSEVVAQGMRTLALTLKLPPEPTLMVRVKADSSPRAGELAALWGNVEKMLTASLVTVPPEIRPIAAQVVAALRPKVEQDRLTTTLDSAALSQMTQLLMPAVHRARASAQRAVSMNQMRQLIVACVRWASEHQGQWPEALDDAGLLAKYNLPESLLQNPRHPDQKPGYIYLRPKAGSTGAANLIVVYEKTPANDDGTAAGFADGHVEWQSMAKFQEALKIQQTQDQPGK